MIEIIQNYIPEIILGITAISGWAYGYIQKISASESKEIVDTIRAGLAKESPDGSKLNSKEILDVVSKALDAIKE